MASLITEQNCFSDVRKVGYLRKPKSMHKRFFVLRAASAAGPSRLEYYENEKKWRHKSGVPKKVIPLETCFNINKRADSKNKHLVALYTKEEYFSVAADSEQEQDLWYQALVDLHNRGKVHNVVAGSRIGEESSGEHMPGPAFSEVWQVILKPKGLGQTKNLIGIYRLCLTKKNISFVKLNSDAAAVVLQLMNIRRCGHSEHFFFIEVGRSAVTGPGEFWMQVDDSVVAQNMHETILEAMKAMSEEFRPRSKSQSSSNCSNPITVPLRRHHHNNPPPSQVGLGRRSRTESVTATSPVGPKHSQSFRVRASSDGEGTMSRPLSVETGPGSPSPARTQTQRHRGASRLHPPLNHSRSIPRSSRCSPSAISPVSLSSSCTSGHGSTSDSLYPRRSSASMSGSPSDGGFISSDEYGSSPYDFTSSFRSVTPDLLGYTPPTTEEELNNYICMDKQAALPEGRSGCSRPCGASHCLEDAEQEKCFRKRTHSSGTPPPPTLNQRNTPSQSSTASVKEYTEMMPANSCSHGSTHREASLPASDSCADKGLSNLTKGNDKVPKDDGYMPMSPGVSSASSKGTDYMPMSPTCVSAPQRIINPRQHLRIDPNGYMMMSPSDSCSPDITTFGKIWAHGDHLKPSVDSIDEKVLSCGDYMNMSPASGSTTSTPPDCYFNSVDEPNRSMYAYFSLPRSLKKGHREAEASPLHLSLSSGRLAFADDSSSTSSDSLGGLGNSQFAANPKRAERIRLDRPAHLSLEDKSSTLSSAQDGPLPSEPKSPGEYVNIEFGDKVFSENTPSEYMNIHLGAQGSTPRTADKSPLSSDDYAIQREDYAPPSPVLVCESLQGRGYSTINPGASCTECSDTQRILNTSVSNDEASSSCVLPGPELSWLGAGPCSGHVGLLGPSSGLSAFTRVTSSPNWKQGAKVIRADKQGRRRHSSETFSSKGNKGTVGSTATNTQEVKRHSSASFENVWFKLEESQVAHGKRESSLGAGAKNHNELNYMDLDLDRVQPPPWWGCSQTRWQEHLGRSGPEDLSAYASISFNKAEE
ncbi:insulin receptor substrate 1-B [Osmerus mordax]|uniref:insulin receptor substrate 1-B n=1 Tax=Osmerus mordax TaxID=8014 RepID=UPI0035105FC5